MTRPIPSLHSPALGDFKPEMRIAKTRIGAGRPCYVIAEAGSNHDGDLKKALALVDAAADAGCDAVKFQTFTAETIAAEYGDALTRLPKEFSRWGKTMRELYRACELPDRFHEPLLKRARKRGIAFFSSPFSPEAVDRLARLRVPAIKIASFELVDIPLIRRAAQTRLPLIMSTGLAGLGDVERALDAAARGGAKSVALLHCGSNYPLGAASAHLAAMDTLRRAFGVPVGYSDHTLGIAVPIAAAALGANLLEKHFTLSRKGSGPDHSFALEPKELKAMVEGIRAAEAAVGLPRKRRQPEEEAHLRRGRRSLFAARDLPAGRALAASDVRALRPGSGLEPLALDLLLGRKLSRRVRAGHPLTWDDFFDSGRNGNESD